MVKIAAALKKFLRSLDGAKSPDTRLWYEKRLKSLVEFLGDVKLKKVSLDDLRDWRAYLADRQTRFDGHPSRPTKQGGLSPYTLHGYIRAARRFFKWLVVEGRLKRSPAARLEFPVLPKAGRRGIAEDDMMKIISAAFGNPRDLALTLFLASTACRAQGVAGLKVSDLKLDRGRATVREKGGGGNRKEREVYLAPAAVEAMQLWLDVRPTGEGDDGAVFVSLKGGALKTSGVYQVIKRLANRAGVEDSWNPHNWRHGAARRMLISGASLAHVSQILGHSTIQVTAQHYGIFADAELKTAHEQHISLPDRVETPQQGTLLGTDEES